MAMKEFKFTFSVSVTVRADENIPVGHLIEKAERKARDNVYQGTKLNIEHWNVVKEATDAEEAE